MRALLLADWYTSKRFLWLYVLLALAFTAGAVSFDDMTSLTFALCAVVMPAIAPQTVLDYDGQSRWDRYAQTLPCTRRQMVRAKYLEGLVCVGIVWAYGTALFCVKAALGGWPWSGALLVSATVVGAGLLVLTLCLGASFCLGVVRGRTVYAVCIVLAGGSGGVLGFLGVGMPSLWELAAGPWVLLLPLAAAAVFAAGWLLSVRWYEKREL